MFVTGQEVDAFMQKNPERSRPCSYAISANRFTAGTGRRSCLSSRPSQGRADLVITSLPSSRVDRAREALTW